MQRFNQPILQISVLWTNRRRRRCAERIFGLSTNNLTSRKPEAAVMPPITGHVAFDHVEAAQSRASRYARREFYGSAGRRLRSTGVRRPPSST
jgi:ABC-type multidrug transport system fused ATPase/permease subunit